MDIFDFNRLIFLKLKFNAMKMLRLLFIFCISIIANNTFSQIKIGYIKNYKSFPSELYVAGHFEKDSIKTQEGNYMPDIKKYYFVTEALIAGKGKSQDVARMNINGKDLIFESKIRKRWGDHDVTSGTTWFSNEKGYKLKYEEIAIHKEGEYSYPTKIKLTVFYKNQKNSIILDYESMGG